MQGQPKFSTSRGRVRDPVDLFPRLPADVAKPDLVRPGPEGESERVPESVRDDPPRIDVRGSDQRVAGHRGPGVRIEPQDRSVERRRIARRPEVLGAECAALGSRDGLRAADAGRRITAGVER